MKLKSMTSLLFLTSASLFFPGLSISQTIGSAASVTNYNAPNPSTIAIGLIYYGMDATYLAVSAYYAEFHRCPPDKLFLKEPQTGISIIDSIYNTGCDVIGQFSSTAPGALGNQIIRILPKSDPSSNHTTVDFSFRAIITTIGFVNNRKNPSFLLSPLKPYRWAPILQNGPFGNVPAASLANALYDNYTTVVTQDTSANSTATTASTSGTGSRISNIVPV